MNPTTGEAEETFGVCGKTKKPKWSSNTNVKCSVQTNKSRQSLNN